VNATDALRLDETFDLDAGRIEAALRTLWQEAAEQSDGMPVARVQVMNLIVYTEDATGLGFIEEVLSLLPERHPCRVVVLEVDADQPRPLSATVSARCLINPLGGRKVCAEEIRIQAGTDTRATLVDALRPLLVTDLPVVLWWTGRPRPADPVFRRFGAELVDRVLVDSALFRDPGAGLLALARWKDDARVRATVADLAWERVRPWRHLLAQTVDPPEARTRLPLLSDVSIGHAGDGAPPEEALLLAGWLAASLRWIPEDSPAHGRVTLRAGARAVTLRFEPTAVTPGPLHHVRLGAADGTTYSVRAADQSGLGICTVEGPDTARMERMVPFTHREPAQVALAAIGRPGHDPVYAAALAAAAEIALLGATA